MLLPILVVIMMTFSPGQFFEFPPKTLSSMWYVSFFNDYLWISSVFTSLIIAILSALLALLLGFPLALWILSASKKIRIFLFAYFCMPLLIPLIVYATGIYLLLSSLQLTDTLIGIVVAHSILGLPFIIIATLSSLNSLDCNLELAARNLGASVTETILKIKLPLCRIGILTGFIFAALNSLNEVVVVLFISGRKITPLSIKMWEGFRYEINPTIAVAAIVMIIAALLITSMNFFLGIQLKSKLITGGT